MSDPEVDSLSNKKQNSYTYWVDETNKSRQLPPEQRPRKVQAPLNHEHHLCDTKPSVWNSCGTWEQKQVPLKSIEQSLICRIKEWLSQQEISEIEIDTVDLEGEVHRIFKRQKWNLMYQIKGTIQFKKNDYKGKVKLKDITDHGDRQFSISGSEPIIKTLRNKAEHVVQILESVLEQYKH